MVRAAGSLGSGASGSPQARTPGFRNVRQGACDPSGRGPLASTGLGTGKAWGFVSFWIPSDEHMVREGFLEQSVLKMLHT